MAQKEQTMKFYEVFILHCCEARKTPSAVAKAAGISRTSVTRWKHGSTPSDVNIAAIASALGLTTEEFWRNGEDHETALLAARGELIFTPPTARGELLLRVAEMSETDAGKLLQIAKICGMISKNIADAFS